MKMTITIDELSDLLQVFDCDIVPEIKGGYVVINKEKEVFAATCHKCFTLTPATEINRVDTRTVMKTVSFCPKCEPKQ